MPVEVDTPHTRDVRDIHDILVMGPVRNQFKLARQIGHPVIVDVVGRCRHSEEQTAVVGTVIICVAHTSVVEGNLNLGGGGIDIDVAPSPGIIVTT